MRSEKASMLNEMRDRVQSSGYVILADFGSMDVATTQELRIRLREVDAEFHVVKNRIFQHLTSEIGVEDLKKGLNGRTAVVTGRGEVTDVAKALKAFTKEKKFPEVKMGALDGAHLTDKDIESLADLPSKDEMRAKLLGTLLAPMSQTVGVLNQKVCSLLYVLKAIETKKSEG
ncbi:MAG: 50S ribosomal protein L10 [Verrucomicrobia bacterium]|nr:50S ribosomal protein L10 [Verrucomicrobiota bacterium]MCH8513460.1 50S ribosomal protein L10 [Kiritimatiellia bacterium]